MVAPLSLGAVGACASSGDTSIDSDGDGFLDTVDCDDQNPAANPDSYEICDGIDNDCDGQIDEADAEGAFTWYLDKDGDGHGTKDDSVLGCEQPDGYAKQTGDCNDDDPAIHPGAAEDCTKDIDFNCDGSSGYDDADMDGHAACNDCNDGNSAINPDAKEICDGIDNDCDGKTDLEQLSNEELCPAGANAKASECKGMDGCATSECDTDWYDVNGEYGDGCECEVDPKPINVGDTCANAIDLGSFSDAAADSKSVTGNDPVGGREIWYQFQANDDTDTNGDEFHVDIRFLKNNNKKFLMDVYKGACPMLMNSTEIAKGESDITDWFTDQNFTNMGCAQGTVCGEGNCSSQTNAKDKCQCNDDSDTFYVRIRTGDATPTCETYELQVSNGKYTAP